MFKRSQLLIYMGLAMFVLVLFVGAPVPPSRSAHAAVPTSTAATPGPSPICDAPIIFVQPVLSPTTSTSQTIRASLIFNGAFMLVADVYNASTHTLLGSYTSDINDAMTKYITIPLQSQTWHTISVRLSTPTTVPCRLSNGSNWPNGKSIIYMNSMLVTDHDWNGKRLSIQRKADVIVRPVDWCKIIQC